MIHQDAYVHPLANVESGATVGAGTRVWQFATVRSGAIVGEECVIGQGAFVDTDVVLGSRCKLENFASVHRGSRVADEVFLGPGVILTNDSWPRATNEDGTLKTEAEWHCQPTRIETRASLGAGVIVLPGVTVGANCMVGAGAVVTKDLASGLVAIGNPAAVVRSVSG